jgi:uncharacterized membrane protein HdeD (DUF308 family)
MRSDIPRRHWRTAAGAVAGAVGGALYAHFVGCRTGTCAITSSIWSAALFFGVTGAIVALPDRTRSGSATPDRDRARP